MVDILAPLPDEETQRIMQRLDDLRTWLCFQGGKADAGLGTALDIVGDARGFIITRCSNNSEALAMEARQGGDSSASAIHDSAGRKATPKGTD